MVRFFRQKDTCSSQIEASAAFLLRVAYGCWGVTHPFWNSGLGPVSYWPLWRRVVRRFMPVMCLVINSHTGQSGRVTIFKVVLFGYGASFITRGDPGNTNKTGFQFGWRGKL